MATPTKVEFVIGARDATRAAFRRVRRTLNALRRRVFSLRTALAGIVTGVAIRGLTRYAQGVERMADAAKSLNVAPEIFEGLAFAAKETSTNVSAIPLVFQRVRRRIGEAVNGSNIMLKSFQNLGVAAKDLRKTSPEEVIDKMIELAREGSPEAFDLIAKIGDVEGLQFVRSIASEFESIEAAVEAARKAGAVRTPEQRAAFEEFNKALRKLELEVVQALLPVMEEFTERLVPLLPSIGEAMRTLGEALIRFIDFMKETDFGAVLGREDPNLARARRTTGEDEFGRRGVAPTFGIGQAIAEGRFIELLGAWQESITENTKALNKGNADSGAVYGS